ncbi:MAG: 4-hydroxy-tetrahydrodipicolinate reductase [Pirellulales bacterium]|nr:4-hydroxy-tetrahydrodipicolinate reductase [Pirellulales bacterium]
MPPLRVVIHGAAGRMGRRLVALGSDDPQLVLVAALDAPGHPRLGEDVGAIVGIGPLGVPLAAELDVDADVLVDFSLPAGARSAVALCVDRALPIVVATTGLGSEDTKTLIPAAAERIPVLWAPNMSRAVNVGMKLAEAAARALADHDADVEILERHHRFKEDAPSGTALRLGELIASAMGQTAHCHGREGRPGARPHGEIGYHAIRAGDNPGEHTIIFGMLGETVEITVRASNRDCYALGALAAAKFLAGKPPGLYTMNDVLGL